MAHAKPEYTLVRRLRGGAPSAGVAVPPPRVPPSLRAPAASTSTSWEAAWAGAGAGAGAAACSAPSTRAGPSPAAVGATVEGADPPLCGYINVSCHRPGGENHKGSVDFWRRTKSAFDAVKDLYNNFTSSPSSP